MNVLKIGFLIFSYIILIIFYLLDNLDIAHFWEEINRRGCCARGIFFPPFSSPLLVIVYSGLKCYTPWADTLLLSLSLLYSLSLSHLLSLSPSLFFGASSSGLVGLLTYFGMYHEGSRGRWYKAGGEGGGTTDLEEARDRCRLGYTCPVDSCACQCLFSLPLHVLSSFLPVALSFTLPALLPVLDRGARFYARTRHVLAYKQQIFLVTSERERTTTFTFSGDSVRTIIRLLLLLLEWFNIWRWPLKFYFATKTSEITSLLAK